jgi:hypothetical protein
MNITYEKHELQNWTGILPGSRKFACEFHFIAWTEISFGVNFGIGGPNFEIHVPFGFFRIGWYGTSDTVIVVNR